MRSLVAVLLLGLAGAGYGPGGEPLPAEWGGAPPPPLDSARGLMERMATAIRDRDPEAMIAAYPDSGPAVFIAQGLRVTSPDSIAALYRGWRDGTVARVQFQWHDVSLQPMGPAAILAHARFTWVPVDVAGAAGDTIHGIWTGAFRHWGGRWALLHEHESWDPP